MLFGSNGKMVAGPRKEMPFCVIVAVLLMKKTGRFNRLKG